MDEEMDSAFLDRVALHARMDSYTYDELRIIVKDIIRTSYDGKALRTVDDIIKIVQDIAAYVDRESISIKVPLNSISRILDLYLRFRDLPRAERLTAILDSVTVGMTYDQYQLILERFEESKYEDVMNHDGNDDLPF